MFTNLGAPELIIIALLLLLFFGGKKIPELVRGVGDAIREFRKGAKEEKKENTEE
jgi:sec-independent protein translocase protein TatA